MIIDKLTGLKVEVRERNIGAAHDPYGETEVALSLPNGDHATYLYNGLGLNRATFYSELNGPEPVREFTWYFQSEVDQPLHKEKMAEAEVTGLENEDNEDEGIEGEPAHDVRLNQIAPG